MSVTTNQSTPRSANHTKEGSKVFASIAKPSARSARPATCWLALSAVVGPVVFTLAWLVLGFLSPGYSIYGTRITPYVPVSAPISGLGLGPTAPFMNAAFVLTGLLIMAGVTGVVRGIPELGGVARWGCAVLLALSGLGAVVDGIFTLESGFLHFIGFLLGLGTPVVSFLVTGLALRRLPRWRRFGSWLLLGSPLTLTLIVLFLLTFSPTWEGARTGVAGLTERLLIVDVQGWFVALGWLGFRAEESAG
jgi:hypothetical membrane protein